MNSRERVELALSHREADRVPLDLGGSNVTGMNVSMVYKLRQALVLDPPGTPVRVVEPYQMLGEIKPDLADALGVDVAQIRAWTRPSSSAASATGSRSGAAVSIRRARCPTARRTRCARR